MSSKPKTVLSEKLERVTSSQAFTWSPLPAKRKLAFTEKNQTQPSQNSGNEESGNKEPYYPNCDSEIWLRSCKQEVTEPLQGETKGKIPTWLNGTLLRNGPGSLQAGENEFQHIFDGSALLHRFGINNGNVTYQCRFLQSEIYKKTCNANRLIITEFGTKAVTDPCQSIFQRISTMFSLNASASDNSLVSIYPFGDQVYACGEMPFIHKIDLQSLETLDRVDLHDQINIVIHTSHPHIMENSSVYNLGLSLHASGPYHSVVCFPKTLEDSDQSMFDNAKIVASIPARWPLHPSYMHTFGITDNYFVIVEQPLSLSIPATLALKVQNEPLSGAFRWYGNEYTQVNVVSRKTGEIVRTFQAETFFFLHIINQYEDSGHVVIDVCAYRDPSMLDCMYVETLKANYAKMFRGRPIRFVLPLNPQSQQIAGESNLITLRNTQALAIYLPNGNIHVKAEKLCNLGCETPRIYYERYSGRKYRYFYAISSDVDAENPGAIIKVDTKEKTCRTWQQENCFPGEPIFVPSPQAKTEDDGLILSIILRGHGETNHVGLLIIDARTFEEIGRTEFQTDSPVPRCLHGWFFPRS
ncbi:hypothetical protein YQE_02194, partial [Dendroctonus ponderosae]